MMIKDSQIDQRLRAVEEAICDIQHRFAKPNHVANWLDQLIGSFKDEPSFDEVIDYGRSIRSQDQPQRYNGNEISS